MTNPTEQFRESVESALTRLENAVSHDMLLRQSQARAGVSPKRTHAEALASIQASTVELFTRLVGEDESPYMMQPPAVYPNNHKDEWGKYIAAQTRDAFRWELRTKIDQLIKDLSK